MAGDALTREEARRLAIARTSYKQLGIGAAAAVFLVWQASAKYDVLHGWGILWLVFASFMIVATAFQALQKMVSREEMNLLAGNVGF